jgi:Recombinase/Helix-turn-helix domain of resolvase
MNSEAPPVAEASVADTVPSAAQTYAAEPDGPSTEWPRRPGRPPSCRRELAARILTLHDQGYSRRAIADVLNTDGLRAPMGQPWTYQAVDRVLHSKYIRDLEG